MIMRDAIPAEVSDPDISGDDEVQLEITTNAAGEKVVRVLPAASKAKAKAKGGKKAKGSKKGKKGKKKSKKSV